MKRLLAMAFLFIVLLQSTPLNAQTRLDSIVRYTFINNGNDSLLVSKRFFDYDGNGRLSAERDLATTNFVHWTDAHRKKYIYDSKGRLERINKENFIDISSSWRTYFYQERDHTSDSDYVVKYYQYFAGRFDTLPKFNRISLFRDGSRKSLAKMSSDNFSQQWITEQFDSLVMNYRQDVVIREYTAGKLFHYSGAASNFFRLDSITAPVFDLKYRSYTSEVPNPPARRRIYITRSKKAPDYKEYSTSDSLVYFLNTNGIPDSSHKYATSWNAPQDYHLQYKNFYTWKGKQMTSHATGSILLLYNKWEFSKSLGGLTIDTVFYKSHTSSPDKETKERTLLDKNGRTQSITYFRWSSMVDSFSINEKDIYYYNAPATSIETKNHEPQPLAIFPNPTNGLIHLKGEIEGSLVLCDLQGRLLSHITPVHGTILISQKGIYLLKHPSSGQVVKVIVQ